MAKIVILGAGSVGCYLGACLLWVGADVVLLGRARVQAHISEYGLRATDYKGRNNYISNADVKYSIDEASLTQADYILVTVKSGDTAAVAQSILKHAKPNAIVVSFQNGVHNTGVLQATLPHLNIVKAMVPFNVLYDNQGAFHCGTQGDLAIEAAKNEFADLLSVFEKAALPVNVYADLTGVQWGKLILNLNNAVNALSGVPLLQQLNNLEYRRVMVQVISEALSVMKQASIRPARTGNVIPSLMPHILALPTWLFKRVAGATLKIDPKARSSMYEDLSLGRKTEIDFLNGEIVSLAAQIGVQAPVNNAIVSLVQLAEQGGTGSPMLSPAQIQDAIDLAKVNSGK